MSTPAETAAPQPTGTAAYNRLPPKIGAWQAITARTQYIDDVRPAGLLHMAVVRSTVAHGDVVGIDLASLRDEPGVVDAFGPEEVATATRELRPALDPKTIGGKSIELYALEWRVRYVGQPVAVVIATTARAARRAAARAGIDYRVLSAVLDADGATAPDAPVLHRERGLADNVLAAPGFSRGDVTGALGAAEHRLWLTVRVPRTTTAPLEPRGLVASWDTETGRLTVDASHQHPFQLRTFLSHALVLDEHQVRVRVPTVGGSFGLKMTGAPEEALAALGTLRTCRPVKWIETREDCSLAGAREQVHAVQVGFDAHGRVLALDDTAVIPVGAGGALPGWRMGYVSAAAVPTGYDVPAVSSRARLVLTNQPPWTSARGWGKEVPVLVMEHVMDAVADKLGLDPVQVRRRNLVSASAMPYVMPSGYSIDSGDFAAVLDAVAEQSGWSTDPPAEHETATGAGIAGVRGTGIAFELTPEGGGHPAGRIGQDAPPVESSPESARVTLLPAGRVVVHSGVTSPGGGNETVIAQLVADRLSLSRDQVEVVQGDTDLCPPGTGNASSRGGALGGAAAIVATERLLTNVGDVLACIDGCDPASIAFIDGRFVSGSRGPRGLAEVADHLRSTGHPEALTAGADYRPGPAAADTDPRMRDGYPYFSCGAYVARVIVDESTGRVTVTALNAVHDCGTVLDRTLVEGQLHGAMAMGIGLALQEQIIADVNGRQVSLTFKDYLVPKANDVPSFEVAHHATPSPRTLLGAKGGGEAGLGGAQAAVVNAVLDAVRRFTGRRPTEVELPLRPPRVRRLLHPPESR